MTCHVFARIANSKIIRIPFTIVVNNKQNMLTDSNFLWLIMQLCFLSIKWHCAHWTTIELHCCVNVIFIVYKRRLVCSFFCGKGWLQSDSLHLKFSMNKTILFVCSNQYFSPNEADTKNASTCRRSVGSQRDAFDHLHLLARLWFWSFHYWKLLEKRLSEWAAVSLKIAGGLVQRRLDGQSISIRMNSSFIDWMINDRQNSK